MNTIFKKACLAAATATVYLSLPSFAQDYPNPPPTAPSVAEPPVRPVLDEVEKGPVQLAVRFFSSQDEKFNELRIVNRSHAIAYNVAKGAISVVSTLAGVPIGYETTDKRFLYGDPITDVRDRMLLISPFHAELPAALDARLTAAIEEEKAAGTIPTYKNELTIKPIGWSLLYNEFIADKEREDEYVLNFSAIFTKVLEGETGGFLRPARKVERLCLYKSKPQKLAVWQQNDYQALAVERNAAIDSCLDQIAPSLPEFLGINANAKIRAAKVNCQNQHKQCVAGADTAEDSSAAKKECKVSYNQCIATDVKPLIDMTPVGQCKATFASCKSSAVDKARAIDPDAKADKGELETCSMEFKSCIAATK